MWDVKKGAVKVVFYLLSPFYKKSVIKKEGACREINFPVIGRLLIIIFMSV